MMKKPNMRGFVMGYAQMIGKTKKPKASEESTDLKKSAKGTVGMVVTKRTEVIKEQPKEEFQLVEKAHRLYLHNPSRLLVRCVGEKYKAVGYLPEHSNTADILDFHQVRVAIEHRFEVGQEEFPKFNTMEDLKNYDTRYKFSHAFRFNLAAGMNVDTMYGIKGSKVFFQDGSSDALNTYIAGSKALALFLDELKAVGIFTLKECDDADKKRMYNFKPNDTDVFILNSDKDTRTKLGDIDVVKSTAKNIADLLQNRFDIPPCQIAVDANGNFILTAHCLYSILNGEYYIHPQFGDLVLSGTYLRTIEFVKSKVKRNDFPNSQQYRYEQIIGTKVRKIQERIEKYATRGFKPIGLDIVGTNVAAMLHVTYYKREY